VTQGRNHVSHGCGSKKLHHLCIYRSDRSHCPTFSGRDRAYLSHKEQQSQLYRCHDMELFREAMWNRVTILREVENFLSDRCSFIKSRYSQRWMFHEADTKDICMESKVAQYCVKSPGKQTLHILVRYCRSARQRICLSTIQMSIYCN
jgi:hypothetical protein